MSDTKQNRRARGAAESLSFLVVVSGILVTLNFIAHEFNLGRVDVTEARRYSLSDGSRRVVSNLDDQLEITAYFSNELPHPYNTLEPYVRDLLQEYQAASGGKIVIRFIHPQSDDEKEDAVSEGLQLIPHPSFEDDSFGYKEGFQGLVLSYLTERKVIPVLRQPPRGGMLSAEAVTSGLEYELTMAIKEVTGDSVRVGILTGHGGPSLSGPPPTQQGMPPQPGNLQGLVQTLPTYNFEEVDASSEIDRGLVALLIIDPETALSETELRHIDQFVMRGGALGVFGGSRKVDVSQGVSAEPVDSGLNTILAAYGARLQPNVVASGNCSVIPLQGPFGIPMQVPYPVFPRVNTTEETRAHPIFFRLPSLVFPWASAIELTTAPEGVSVDVLAATSEEHQTWAITGESLDVAPRQEGWSITGERGPFNLMVAIEGALPSAFAGVSSEAAEQVEAPARSPEETRVLVVGTGTAFDDQLRGIFRPGDMAVYLNALDWLAADADLIAVRAKNVGEADIEVPQDVQQADEARREAAAAAQQAQLQGDANAAEDSVEDFEAAQEEFEQAEEEWNQRKNMMRWGTTLGIPFFFGLFGIIRWRMRQSRRQNFKL